MELDGLDRMRDIPCAQQPAKPSAPRMQAGIVGMHTILRAARLVRVGKKACGGADRRAEI
jgi:hypothetical protein